MPPTERISNVFISATAVDLSEYALEVKRQLENSGFQVTSMGNFGSQPEDAVEVSLTELENTDAVVGIYARRYGYIPAGDELSVTEQEYHHARKLGKPVFAFVVDDSNTDLKPGPGEDDGSPESASRQEKLGHFISLISTALVRERFQNVADLCDKVTASLSRYNKRPGLLYPQVETLRLVLDDSSGISLFQNDLPLDRQTADVDLSLKKALHSYQEQKQTGVSQQVLKSPNAGIAPLEQTLEELGDRLGNLLFSQTGSDHLRSLITEKNSVDGRLQIGFKPLDDKWKPLPLETARISGMTFPLALRRGVDLFRLSGNRAFDTAPSIAGPLKILMAIAAPIEGDLLDLLDYEKELGKVMDIVEKIPDFGKPERRPIVHILDQGALESICEACNRNRYHILHISAHGEPGLIYLEDDEGTVKKVMATDFVNRFPEERKPLLTLLSACYTGMTAEMTSFAETLTENGFQYVIAMQETVSDRYATAFAETLYRKLAYDDKPCIEKAVSETRFELEQQRLEDNQTLPAERRMPPEWMTPVLYKANPYRYHLYDTDPLHYQRQMEPAKERFKTGLSHRLIGEFVGRRRQLLTLKQKVVKNKEGRSALITGMGGVGKSTLVARCLADAIHTGQQFDLVTHVGPVNPVDLLREFGCQGETIDALFRDFFENRLPVQGKDTLFLFDNFEENLVTPDDSQVPSLPEEETLPELSDPILAAFLARLVASAQTRLIITSRYPFRLPDNQHRSLTRIPLGTISIAEIRKLMERLQGFAGLSHTERIEVVHTIGGHPRTLEFLDAILRDGQFTYQDVQTRLNRRLPEEVLDSIKKRASLTEDLRAAVSLAARDCFLEELLSRLSPEEKTLLFDLSVFRDACPQSVIAWLCEKEGLPLDQKPSINRLINLSLVHPAEEDYHVHRWTADYFRLVMGPERWQKANRLAGDCLYEPDRISLNDAMEAWRHYLVAGNLEMADKVAGPLEDKLDVWGHWNLRRQVCVTMVEATREIPESLARWLHTNGILDQQLGNYDEALTQYRKSLEIREKLGNQKGMATSYHQLGIISQLRGDYDEALIQYRKSLEIEEKLGDQSGMANSFGQLGMISQERGDYDEALIQYRKSLEILEKLGDQSGMATSYHQLGRISEERGDYDEALIQYR
ncbi:MAG: tetratricopeptide repeat protein, partial [bacterium]